MRRVLLAPVAFPSAAAAHWRHRRGRRPGTGLLAPLAGVCMRACACISSLKEEEGVVVGEEARAYLKKAAAAAAACPDSSPPPSQFIHHLHVYTGMPVLSPRPEADEGCVIRLNFRCVNHFARFSVSALVRSRGGSIASIKTTSGEYATRVCHRPHQLGDDGAESKGLKGDGGRRAKEQHRPCDQPGGIDQGWSKAGRRRRRLMNTTRITEQQAELSNRRTSREAAAAHVQLRHGCRIGRAVSTSRGGRGGRPHTEPPAMDRRCA